MLLLACELNGGGTVAVHLPEISACIILACMRERGNILALGNQKCSASYAFAGSSRRNGAVE